MTSHGTYPAIWRKKKNQSIAILFSMCLLCVAAKVGIYPPLDNCMIKKSLE